MTSKAEFNAEEWEKIQQGPAVAGIMVIASDRGGSLRESIAVGKVYVEAAAKGQGTIVGEIASTPPKIDRDAMGTKEELVVRGPQIISEAVSILEAHATPEEVDEFRHFCLEVAEHAAERTKTGGFLGIGGSRISQAESTTLDEIASTLGIERSQSGPAPADAD